MDKEHLAIASVPCQNWGETYAPEQALCTGTIFKELNKPFFITDKDDPNQKDALKAAPKSLDRREKLMKQITEISFYLDDLTLYLDTHPEDPEALALFKDYSVQRKSLKMEFTKAHDPLTRDCMADCADEHTGWCWQEGPVPWEGACV